MQTVHPHRCGETIIYFILLCNTLGSPPQVWGNPRDHATSFTVFWFTPTGVGKPYATRWGRRHRKVHPHRCGETASGFHCAQAGQGSPPQVWGNLTISGIYSSLIRFTPTGVGKPRIAARFVGCREVHPHRCGETATRTDGANRDEGSPPQVWGNRPDLRFDRLRHRFTPTGVGKPLLDRLA